MMAAKLEALPGRGEARRLTLLKVRHRCCEGWVARVQVRVGARLMDRVRIGYRPGLGLGLEVGSGLDLG